MDLDSEKAYESTSESHNSEAEEDDDDEEDEEDDEEEDQLIDDDDDDVPKPTPVALPPVVAPARGAPGKRGGRGRGRGQRRSRRKLKGSPRCLSHHWYHPTAGLAGALPE